MTACAWTTTSQHKFKRYYKRRIELGLSSLEANYDNQDLKRKRTKLALRRYHEKWGNPDRNSRDYFLREIGREYGLLNREEARHWVATHGL